MVGVWRVFSPGEEGTAELEGEGTGGEGREGEEELQGMGAGPVPRWSVVLPQYGTWQVTSNGIPVMKSWNWDVHGRPQETTEYSKRGVHVECTEQLPFPVSSRKAVTNCSEILSVG